MPKVRVFNPSDLMDHHFV